MPWRGFEPRRLSALPPQDSVSTSFTTKAEAEDYTELGVAGQARGHLVTEKPGTAETKVEHSAG